MVAALALAATSLPAMAQSSGDIDITGATLETIELTINDGAATFGTLTPDGLGGGADTSLAEAVVAGACYTWDNGTDNVEVRSNVAYDLSIAVTGDDKPQLFFDETPMTTYVQCNSGTPAEAASLDGVLHDGDGRTAIRQYDSYLAAVVPWDSDPFDVITTLTFTAAADV